MEFYNKVKENGSSFEIVFISSDPNEETFEEYFGEMPWLALPFNNREQKQKLSTKLKVRICIVSHQTASYLENFA